MQQAHQPTSSTTAFQPLAAPPSEAHEAGTASGDGNQHAQTGKDNMGIDVGDFNPAGSPLQKGELANGLGRLQDLHDPLETLGFDAITELPTMAGEALLYWGTEPGVGHASWMTLSA